MDIKFSHFAIECPKCQTKGHILPMHPAGMPVNFSIWKDLWRGYIHIKCKRCGYEEIYDFHHRQRGWEGEAPAVAIVGEVDENGKQIWRGGHHFIPI